MADPAASELQPPAQDALAPVAPLPIPPTRPPHDDDDWLDELDAADTPLAAGMESIVDDPADALLPLQVRDEPEDPLLAADDVALPGGGDPLASDLLPMPASDRSQNLAATARPAHSGTVTAPSHSSRHQAGHDQIANHGGSEAVVCPFCAHVRPADAANAACPRCTMQDTASTRRSTGERIGPWFVLQRKNPTAPGLRFSVLLTLARRGHVTPRSIVRGPTTGQLWRYAAQVKGLSRVFGVCWHCSAGVSPDATTCPHCRSAQEIPDDPDIFLESYASLPVMRDTSSAALMGPPAAASNQLATIPAAVEGTVDPEPPGGPKFGSRQITADHAPHTGRRGSASRNASPRGDRRPPASTNAPPPAPARNLPERRPTQPARPAAAGEDAPIMSASELAAVFQLESTQRRGAVRRVGRFAWRVTRVAAAFALVLAAGGVIVGMMRPDWAAQAQQYVEPRGRALWAKVSGVAGTTNTIDDATARPVTLQTTGNDQPPPTPIVSATGDMLSGNASPDGATPRDTVVTDPTRIGTGPSSRPSNPFPRNGANALPPANAQVQLDGLGGFTSTFMPATRPAAAAIQANVDANVAVKPPATQPTDLAQANTSAPNANDSTPAQGANEQANAARELANAGSNASAANIVPPAPPPTPRREPTLDESITQAGVLRNDALDAEARRDWRAAIMIYEQIMRLPEAAWPSDVKPRLEIARQNLSR